VEKRYVALLDGVVTKREGRIELPIRGEPSDRPRQIYDPADGKPSITEFKVLSIENGMTRVAFFPKTGRTHQLRVHASHPLGLGVPILGDSLYGRVKNRLHLHAEMLRFQHPQKSETVEFTSPCPF
jgi:tRNA pseudouridine32 synthase/23S rRNA pseudouridine746 synthase